MKKLFIALLAFGGMTKVQAQVDPHFSQYYVAPMWLNPSLAGTSDAAYRVAAIYRNQWHSISNAFSTIGVSGDVATGSHINFGGNVLQQSAGSGGYTYTNSQLAISYTGMQWGAEGQNHVSIAVQGGFLSRRFDPSKLQGGDQWVPGMGYNPALPSSDALTKTSSAAFDAGAGVSYYNAALNRKVNPFIGAAITHLTRPEDPFLATGAHSRLPIRFTVHGGARIAVSESMYIVPNALVLSQGNAREIMVGGYAQLKAGENADLMLGANYRFKDAIAPFAGILFNNLMIGASYDVNTSQLGKMAGGANAFEISLTFLGAKKLVDNSFKCPRF